MPHHSTFSKNCHGRVRDSETLRFVFDEVMHCAMTEGLIKGEGFAVDASVVKVDANRQRGVPDKKRWIGHNAYGSAPMPCWVSRREVHRSARARLGQKQA